MLTMKYLSAAVLLAVAAVQDVDAFSVAGKMKSRVSSKAADMPSQTLSMTDADTALFGMFSLAAGFLCDA